MEIYKHYIISINRVQHNRIVLHRHFHDHCIYLGLSNYTCSMVQSKRLSVDVDDDDEPGWGEL